MIHEFLSDPNWINPQIDYLLWLQNIRMHSSRIFETIFLYITRLGELYIPTIVMALIYWCIDSETGIYLFALNACGLWLSKIFKMAACVYRPWVLSDKIHPAQAAIKMAKGYSFPSGHTLMATTTWGGLAFVLRKLKIICALLVILVLLIGFSRNYVGVHTPQDVLCSLFIGLFLIFAAYYLLKWCTKNKNRYLYLLPVIDILGIITLLYIIFKPYPADYVNGKLLVDPKGAIYIAVLYMGWILGILNGLFLSKRFFPFDAQKGSLKFKITSALVGIILLGIICAATENYLFASDRSFVVVFGLMFVIGLFITAIYPYILTKLQNKTVKSED